MGLPRGCRKRPRQEARPIEGAPYALGGADSVTYAKRGYRQAMQTQIEQGIFDFCGAPVVTSELITMDHAEPASLPLAAAQFIIRRLS